MFYKLRDSITAHLENFAMSFIDILLLLLLLTTINIEIVIRLFLLLFLLFAALRELFFDQR